MPQSGMRALNRISSAGIQILFVAFLALIALPASSQFSSNEQFVTQQYRDIARREAGLSEINFWITQPQGPALPRGLIESYEVQGLQAPVVRLYFAYFNRIPDYAGFTFVSFPVK